MKNFFRRLGASLSSTEYYRSVLYQSFWEVFSFYLGFLALLSLVITVVYWVSILPHYEQVLDQTVSEISTNYPADLHIDWNGTELRSSTTPLAIPFPSFVSEEIKGEDEYLATIASDSAVPSTRSFFLISPTKFYSVNEGELSSGVNLSDLIGPEPIFISQETLPSHLTTASDFMHSSLLFAGYVFPVMAFVYLLVSSMYIVLIETAIIFLLLKLQQSPLSFRQLFQLNLSLFVPAQIISNVTHFAKLDVPISMLSLSFWILFVFVYFSIQKKLPK